MCGGGFPVGLRPHGRCSHLRSHLLRCERRCEQKRQQPINQQTRPIHPLHLRRMHKRVSKRCDFSTRALERTRPGERPPARWTARTVPRFSSMTPPSMHSSLLRILCICGTGCTSECQKDRLQHARRTTHTGTGGSPAAAFTWTRCVVRRDDSRACTTPVDPRHCLGRASALPRLPVLLNRNQRCACLQERPS